MKTSPLATLATSEAQIVKANGHDRKGYGLSIGAAIAGQEANS